MRRLLLGGFYKSEKDRLAGSQLSNILDEPKLSNALDVSNECQSLVMPNGFPFISSPLFWSIGVPSIFVIGLKIEETKSAKLRYLSVNSQA